MLADDADARCLPEMVRLIPFQKNNVTLAAYVMIAGTSVNKRGISGGDDDEFGEV
ncbi:MAG: hypothetical protein WDZ54_10600 [Sneathiella sp.]